MQYKEERAEKKLVGHGIEELAEDSALLEPAGEHAIKGISDSGEDEESKGSAVMQIEDGKHDERNNTQPQERELVGSCAQFSDFA
jgi:hypothetical protein